METKTITIEEKKPYTGNAERHPVGDFYANGDKYTCWDETFYATFNPGDVVQIDYTEKVNGQYVNKNISKMAYVASETVSQAEPQSQTKNSEYSGYPNSDINVGNVVISGIAYEVIMRVANG